MKRRSARCQVVQLQAPLCQSLFALAAGGHGQPEPGVHVLGALMDERPRSSNALKCCQMHSAGLGPSA